MVICTWMSINVPCWRYSSSFLASGRKDLAEYSRLTTIESPQADSLAFCAPFTTRRSWEEGSSKSCAPSAVWHASLSRFKTSFSYWEAAGFEYSTVTHVGLPDDDVDDDDDDDDDVDDDDEVEQVEPS